MGLIPQLSSLVVMPVGAGHLSGPKISHVRCHRRLSIPISCQVAASACRLVWQVCQLVAQFCKQGSGSLTGVRLCGSAAGSFNGVGWPPASYSTFGVWLAEHWLASEVATAGVLSLVRKGAGSEMCSWLVGRSSKMRSHSTPRF